MVLYTYIGVGLSALLVSADRAMREPRYVERAADWLHVFFYILQNKIGQFGAIDGSVIRQNESITKNNIFKVG